MISVKNLYKNFGALEVLKNVNLHVNKGEVVAIIGPSGSGKSTLLRSINHLEVPTSGEIFVGGQYVTDSKKDITTLRQNVGMVFQHFNLFGHMTVLKNMIYAPVKTKRMTKEQAAEKAMQLLKRVGLEDKANVYPVTLSGGQKQRVAIARALAMDPQVILFDEPTSALDPEMVTEVLDVIKKVAAQGYTMLLVSHEMNFIRHVSNRVIFLDKGHVVEDGTPKEVFEHPQNQRTREFFSKMHIMAQPEYVI